MQGTRALIVLRTGYWAGGIERYVETLVPSLVASAIDPTVLVCGTVTPEFERRLATAGASSIGLGAIPDDMGSRSAAERQRIKRRLGRVVREAIGADRYDVVHVNSSVPWIQAASLRAAREAGIPVRLAHCHSNPDDVGVRRWLTRALHRMRILRDATGLLACSNAAGRYLYGGRAWWHRGIMAKNGIDIARFAHRREVRDRLRAECPGSLVIGNVGRLSPEKNQAFLIEAFAEVLRIRPDARLWLVGAGPEEGALAALARQRGIEGAVTFWGSRDDVSDLLQAMDCFVLPSLHEGLPISLVEAQAAGLPCVVSAEAVTSDAVVPGCHVDRVSLREPCTKWAQAIVACAGGRVGHADDLVRVAGFDSAESGAAMARLYKGEAPDGRSLVAAARMPASDG